MTGPEHYRAAEELLAMLVEQQFAIAAGDPTAGPQDEPKLAVAAAQVHATLAGIALQASATILADSAEWDAAMSGRDR